MAIKLVVFDIAGTTVKDDHDVSKAFRAALKKFDIDVPLETINPLMGYEKTQAIRKILLAKNQDRVTDELVSNIHQEFVAQMIKHYQTAHSIAPLPNVEETFKKLHKKQIKVGINTGFSRDIADTIMQRLGWVENGLVDYVIGSDEVEKGRPHPFMIQKLMNEAGITEAEEVAKVGDTEVDVREGQNAGCQYIIGITTGIFTKEELETYHPTHIIDNMAELMEIIG